MPAWLKILIWPIAQTLVFTGLTYFILLLQPYKKCLHLLNNLISKLQTLPSMWYNKWSGHLKGSLGQTPSVDACQTSLCSVEQQPSEARSWSLGAKRVLDPKSTIHSDIAVFTSYGMSAVEERVRSFLSIIKFDLKTYSIANKFISVKLPQNKKCQKKFEGCSA